MKLMRSQAIWIGGMMLFLCLCGAVVFRNSFLVSLPYIIQQQSNSVPCSQPQLQCWQLATLPFAEHTDLFSYNVEKVFLVKKTLQVGTWFGTWPIYRDLYFLKIEMKVTKDDLTDRSGFSAAHTMLTVQSAWGSRHIPLSYLYPFADSEVDLIHAVPELLPHTSVTGTVVYDITQVKLSHGDDVLLSIVNLPRNVGGVKLLTVKSQWPLFSY